MRWHLGQSIWRLLTRPRRWRIMTVKERVMAKYSEIHQLTQVIDITLREPCVQSRVSG
jgi:hypothetical protein